MASSNIEISLSLDDSLATLALIATLMELADNHQFIPASMVCEAVELWNEEQQKEADAE